MNNTPKNTIALYTTFSNDFVKQCKYNGNRLRLDTQVRLHIANCLLKYAYKKYFDIDVDTDTLLKCYKQKEYRGIYFDYSQNYNAAVVTLGKSPMSIGWQIQPLNVEWLPSSDLLHVNEYKQYEQSGRSVETLCCIWCKKKAFRKLHNIERPSDDPFDNSFNKEFDSTTTEYTMLKFDYDRYAHYVAVTGKSEFAEVPVEDIFRID